MNPDTRQTLIGVCGLTVVFVVALLEGHNGRVAATYAVAVIAVVAPQALDSLPFQTGGKR